jgi:MYXO-CTERM domain-containing protein
VVDEGTTLTDDDGDGFTEGMGDCDDDNVGVNPAATESENDIDDDCDGLIDEDFSDVDGDGVSVDEGDCDDTDGWVHPGQTEICDGLDNNCDGEIDENGCAPTGGLGGEKPGCGCSGPGQAPSPWWGVLALVMLRRRRR